MFKNQPNKMATSTQLYKNAMRHYFPYDDVLKKKSNVKYNFMNIFFFKIVMHQRNAMGKSLHFNYVSHEFESRQCNYNVYLSKKKIELYFWSDVEKFENSRPL